MEPDFGHWLARLLGAAGGALASVIIIAPQGTRNMFYRLWVGVSMGVVFSPLLRAVSWMKGESFDMTMARSAAMGVVIWFVLEGVTRLMSRRDWVVRLAEEVIRLRYGGGRK